MCACIIMCALKRQEDGDGSQQSALAFMSCLIGEDEESKLAWLLRAHQTASTITVSKSFASQGLVSVCITTKKNSQGIRRMVALICSNQSSSQNTSSHEDRQVVLICSNHVIYGIPGMGPHGIRGPGRPLRLKMATGTKYPRARGQKTRWAWIWV